VEARAGWRVRETIESEFVVAPLLLLPALTSFRGRICIWKPGLEHSPSDSPIHSPRLDLGLSEVIDTGPSSCSRSGRRLGLTDHTLCFTGHSANIFSIKWAPHVSTRLFSCAGDSTARPLAPARALAAKLTKKLATRNRSGSSTSRSRPTLPSPLPPYFPLLPLLTDPGRTTRT
jgi:hypothetical protein